MKTARFRGFAEVLLQVGHRYDGGVGTDIRAGSSQEGEKTELVVSQEVGP